MLRNLIKLKYFMTWIFVLRAARRSSKNIFLLNVFFTSCVTVLLALIMCSFKCCILHSACCRSKKCDVWRAVQSRRRYLRHARSTVSVRWLISILHNDKVYQSFGDLCGKDLHLTSNWSFLLCLYGSLSKASSSHLPCSVRLHSACHTTGLSYSGESRLLLM